MLNFKNICFSTLLVLGFIATQGCKKNTAYRYISDTDTTFSADVRAISKKINNAPTNAELFYIRAKTFYFIDKYKDALIDIDYALVLDSINPLYHFTKGQYLMAGDTANAKEAEKSYNNAIRLKKDYLEAYLAIAKIQFAKQNYTNAEQNYFEASKLDPSNALPYFYIGLMAKEQKDTAKAIALFEKTLAYDDKYYDAIMQLANYYAEKNDKKCVALFDKALKINEFSDEALYAKGLFLQNQNLYKDASILYQEVAKINPSHKFCRYNLAYINTHFKNYTDALDLLNETIKLDENYADAYTLRGFVKENMRNTLGANSDYQMALQLDKEQKLATEGLKRVKVITSF